MIYDQLLQSVSVMALGVDLRRVQEHSTQAGQGCGHFKVPATFPTSHGTSLAFHLAAMRSGGQGTGANRRGLPYLEGDLPAKSSQFGTLRPTTVYGRYHHLRNVAGQAFDAPRPLDSRSVTRKGPPNEQVENLRD